MISLKLSDLNSRKTSIDDCLLMDLPRIYSRAGNITPIENFIDLPFSIKRVFYVYDIPGGEARGGHAHKELNQLIIAASGSFDVLIDDGTKKKIINLNRPYLGIHLIPGIWSELINFSSGSISLVLASELYYEKDYIRNYKLFLEYKGLK
ncbi:FdtA/QdtA family cupin domain-containing protein [Bacteroidota bacterium]